MLGARWGMLAPQLVHEQVTMNRLVYIQEQDRQQRPLLPAAQVGGGPVDGDFQLPQQAITDHFTPPSTVKHARARADSWRKGVLACDVSFL